MLFLIAATAVINFINFTDGLDGLVAGCMVVLFAVAALTGMPALWPLVGALFGFYFGGVGLSWGGVDYWALA